MILLFLLLLPLLISLAGLILDKGKVTWKEFLIQEGVLVLVVGVGYWFALKNKSDDVEHWNGVIAKKWQETGSCCHSYSCNCHESCSGSGNSRSCSTHCETCYEHIRDKEWYATTSNGEMAYEKKCGRPLWGDPERWEAIVVGEPTSIPHSFTNYVKGNPDSVLRRQGLTATWQSELPAYPEVFDHYRANKVLMSPNISRSNMPLRSWNYQLAELNGSLGAAKQVNVIIVVTKAADRIFTQALQEHWLGGKKNDVVLVVGAPNYPDIAWTDVMSWSRSEEMKIEIRDRVQALGQLDVEKIIPILREEVAGKFVRRKFADFDYLKSTIEPSSFALWFLGILGVLLSVGMWIFFHREDVFGEERFASRLKFQGFRARDPWRDQRRL
jgi:hypothetical protein